MDAITQQLNNPEWLRQKVFFLKNAQWVELLIIILSAALIKALVHLVSNRILIRLYLKHNWTNNDNHKKLTAPIAFLIFLLVYFTGLNMIDLNKSQYFILKRVYVLALTCGLVWLGHRLVELAGIHFIKRAEATSTKFDDILVPLLKKSTLVVIYITGGIYIAHTLNFSVSSLVAGLGIGGLAFAFAAKDTLANLFGSVMLILDRPFDVGDFVSSGGVEGTVTEVGFRSTRIRTTQDSIITVSNGQLANQVIENRGRRRFRRFESILNLTTNTPVSKIEALCEGIKYIIVNHPYTKKDEFYVNFNNIGSSSFDVKVVAYFTTQDIGREFHEKHRLLIDLIRLMEELKIELAYPTQTIFHAELKDSAGPSSLSNYYQEGVSSAQKVVESQITRKGFSADRDQFEYNRNK